MGVLRDLREEYGEALKDLEGGLAVALQEIYVKTDWQFIFLIDKWDCVMRERQGSFLSKNMEYTRR